MTKRFFALVMVLVLAMSMLTIPAFASGTLTKDDKSNKLTFTWDGDSQATKYEISWLKVTNNNSVVVHTQIITDMKAAKTATYTPAEGGTYKAQCAAKKGGETLKTDTSNPVEIKQTSTGTGGIKVTSNGASTDVSWSENSYGTGNYYVAWTLKNGNSSNRYVKGATNCTISESYDDLRSITVYNANKEANSYNGQVGTWQGSGSSSSYPSGDGTIEGTGTLKATRVGASVSFYWNAVPYATQYRLAYNTDGSTYYNYANCGINTFYTANLGTTSNYYVVLQAYVNNNWQDVGMIMVPASYQSGITGTGVYASRNSSSDYNVYLQWSGNSGTMYVVTYAPAGGQTQTQVAYVNYATVSCDPSQTWTFIVAEYGSSTTVGMATLNAYATSSQGSAGGYNPSASLLNISRGTSSATVSWTAVPGAYYYLVSCTSANKPWNKTTSDTTVTVPYGTNDTWNVTVQAFNSYGQPIATVGTASVSPSGGVQQNQQSSNTGSSTTNGQNCMVVSYPTYAELTWNPTGSPFYTVTYSVNENPSLGSRTTCYTNTVRIDVANTYGFTAYVQDYNGNLVASVSVSAKSNTNNNSGSNITKTEIKNLTATPYNGWQTTISWSKKSGDKSYIIYYGELVSSATQEDLTISTSYVIPYGSTRAYKVYVFAITTDNKTYEVGHIYNVPGSTPGTTTPSTTGKAYASNLKAVSGNKKVTLSWTAANNANSYTIYYRRANASKWTKAGSVTKTAVNLTGLTNDVSYQFKVVANNVDSGIVTIAPSASSSKTVLAADPDDDSVNLGDDIKLTSVASNSKGTASVSWTAVSGATSYRVYMAEGSSSVYSNKGTFTGTSATITGLTSGTTYKVRVVAIPYGSDLKTALQACAYMSVKVK